MCGRYRAGVQGTLMFTRAEDVVPDEERPGLLRAPVGENDDIGDVRVCELRDLSESGVTELGLEEAGFETVDLSANTALQRTLDEVRDADRLTDETAAALREAIAGTTISLANGRTLQIDLVADDGLFHRRSGPNGIDVNARGIEGINGHGGAAYVHGDQDVYGTPLRQLMHGAAPDMFRHLTPDGRNDDASTFLLNLWIPLHAPVQPLALMDVRTLDGRRHQLRYGLPVDGFLEREDDATVNDIWNFLHHEDQQWYVRPDMGNGEAYLFNTLGTPHGAAILPGEAAIAELFVALHDAADGLPAAPVSTPLPADAPPAIRALWERMTELLAADREAATWPAEARAAADAAIRRSIEMRLIATLVD